MPLTNSEKDNKLQMLLKDPTYRLPSDISGFDRASIAARIDQQENNRYIQPPSFGYGNARDRAKLLPPTVGGKSKKLRKNKKSRRNRSRK